MAKEKWTRKMIIALIQRSGGEVPAGANKMRVDLLFNELANRAEDLGYQDGAGVHNNPFDSEQYTAAFQKYEDGFNTRVAEDREAEEGDHAAAEKEKEELPPPMTVEDIKRKDPSKVTAAEREFMKSQGLVFTSSGWGVELSMPASAGRKREKRAPKKSIAPIVEEMLRAGKSDAEILERIAVAVPGAKTTSGCIAWYASKLRNKGVQLPNRPRNVIAGKKAEPDAPKTDAENTIKV